MDQTSSYSIANFQGTTNHSLPLSNSTLLPQALPPLQQPQTQAQTPLRPLQTPLALLAVAHSLRSSAQLLLPSLSKPPQSQNSHLRYAKAWTDYYRLATASIVVLRAAVSSASTGEFRGGRIELRANAMLAEQLADLYEGSEHVEAVISEGEVALTRAVSRYPLSFTPFSAHSESFPRVVSKPSLNRYVPAASELK